ncbi:MAG TPA: protein phosphatase 2C domain-containing protein [Thermomicrobiales bacterium]|nr:protein phosphatase 2C domain-containing protein [Thermomicrobiales bacterium]
MTDRQTLPALPDTLAIAVAAASDVGGRPSNEDVALAIELTGAGSAGDAPPAFLLAVADGMGGHAGGEVASRLAIETIRDVVAPGEGGDAALLLKQAFRRANEAIVAEAEATGADGMGTTLTAAILRGKYATVASVGDSRAYLLRGRGVTQVTKDHSLVAEQVARGELTPDEARASPRRNVLTHALGTQPKLARDLPAVFELTLLPEDRLLLCTDGFHDVLEQNDYARILAAAAPEEAVDRLIRMANERGTTDNVSAAVAVAVPTRIPTALPTPTSARGIPVGAIAAAAIAAILILLLVAALLLGVVP